MFKKQTTLFTLKIDAVSNISDMKVETPFNWLSPDPTRAKIESVMEISAELHGTKQPSWAISTITPVCEEIIKKKGKLSRNANQEPFVNNPSLQTNILEHQLG